MLAIWSTRRECPGILSCLAWLLLASAMLTNGQHLSRKLRQAEDFNAEDVSKVATPGARKRFLALKNPDTAGSQDVQQLYDQGASVAAIAYLLFAAATPLSDAEGSSNALLPYLTPTLLKLYVSQPGTCSSSLAERLYGLSQSLYGSEALEACHYDLYKALGATFEWARDNIALRQQDIEGQPFATALWPDREIYPNLEFAAAVYDALLDDNKLGETAGALRDSCGLSGLDFAALIPGIAAALTDLHADLAVLQKLASHLHESRFKDGETHDDDRRRSMLERRNGLSTAAGDPHFDAVRRRSALTLPSNFQYSMPPSNFVVLSPANMPQLMIPLVFHIMLYQDGSITGPTNYGKSLAYVQRLVRVTNIMAKPTSMQFFIKEVRNNATTYPYLLLSSRASWLRIPAQNCTGGVCFSNEAYMSKAVSDWPRSINVFVSSDSTSGVPLGYAYVPGSDLYPENGHVFMTWDSLSVDGSNSRNLYDDGPNTLLHEIYHHFGLHHPSDFAAEVKGCIDGDYVIDTPTSLGPISGSSFFTTAQSYCMELFWGQYGGDWSAAYQRWSTTLGTPETDMNAWADSCPTMPGYDELGNYMTYNTPVCFAALGHFSPGQAQRAHFMTAELNPVMYAWGQYYADNAAPPPPETSPPPEIYNNTCRATAKSNCACKSSWTSNGVTYSYCDRTGLTNSLTCEVETPASCADCATGVVPCILACTGTARQCKRSLAPGTNTPPPPPPRPPSPPPLPPPPPPRAVPSACKKTLAGCECRSTWAFGSTYSSYCASPDGDPQLWCQVSSSCVSFNNTNAYQYCDTKLNATYCGGQVFFSTTRTPPAPPAPPPDLRPRPPPASTPPSLGTVAEVLATFTINANCALLAANETALRYDTTRALASALSVSASYIKIVGLKCGSIIVDYAVQFPSGATAEQVLSVSNAVGSFVTTVGPGYESTWGDVTSSSLNRTDVLQASLLCPPGTPVSPICPASPPPPPFPPPPEEKKNKTLRLIIVIIIAVVASLLLILVVTLIVCCIVRKRRAVAPQPERAVIPPTAYPPPGAAPYQPNDGYAGAPAANNYPQQYPQQQPQYAAYPPQQQPQYAAYPPQQQPQYAAYPPQQPYG